jgi:hypothetical protein
MEHEKMSNEGERDLDFLPPPNQELSPEIVEVVREEASCVTVLPVPQGRIDVPWSSMTP